MSKIVIADYMEKFSCIGPKCEDDCCHGWTVFIDKETYDKYEKIKDVSITEKISKYLKKNDSCNCEFNYGIMSMKENGICPMQEDTKLCEIHKKYGADALSTTCYVYPKMLNCIGKNREMSGALSCPEIARVALLNSEKIKFTFIDETKFNSKILKTAVKNIKSKEINSGWKSYIKEIRSAAIEIIQNRESKMIERVLYLGLFMKKLSEIAESGKTDEVENCIKQYIEEVRRVKEFKISKEITQNSKVHFDILKSICIARREMGEDFSYIYDKVFEKFEFDKEADDELIKRYEKNYFKYARRFFNENEYIMENFLVNELFQNVFPYGNNIFKSYVELVIKYGLFKYITTAFAIENKELNNEILIESVYRYSRAFEHSQKFMDDMYERIKESGFDNLSYMTLIMKI